MEAKKFSTTDEYLESLSGLQKQKAEEIRALIRAEDPEAKERISYNMPAFALDGNLVYFAAYANHIGFYATPTGNEAFAEELKHYKTGKGSIQFPINEDLPAELIRRIVRHRINENKEKARKKSVSKK